MPKYVIKTQGNYTCLQVSDSEVKAAISSFPTSSVGGPDGLCLQHVPDLLNCLAVGPALYSERTTIINLLSQYLGILCYYIKIIVRLLLYHFYLVEI